MRKKKYIEIKNMGALGIDLIETLKYDVEFEQRLTNRSYTITTSGGSNILWEVNETDAQFYTVSTGELRRIGIGGGRSVPQYQHFVLTEEGLRECKQQIVMNSL